MSALAQPPLSARLRTASSRFVRFFLGSACGLVVDLGGFSALTALGIAPGVANLISSFSSITVVYLLVTRFAFGVGVTRRTYVYFIVWYSVSIVLFSALIAAAAVATREPAILCKLATVPISFGLNYLFSRWLFARATKSVRAA